MPPFTDIDRLFARAVDNDTNDDAYVAAVLTNDNNPDNPNDRHHKRLEIGVIVAIIVAGIAIIGTIATCIVKQRRRARKRAAKRAKLELTGYRAGDEPKKKKREAKKGDIAIGVALGGEEGSGGAVKPKKVSFAAAEGEAPPPSYEIVVTTKDMTN